MLTEQEVIEQLSNYKRLQARMQVLSTYNVGAGITVSRLHEDDQLQPLHQKLRGQATYMYLNPREQDLETVAHVYLEGNYPSGLKAQHRAIAQAEPMDEEDAKALEVLKAKIKNVMKARGYDLRHDFDDVLNRVAEFQDIKAELLRIDNILKVMEQYKPEYAELLRMKYIDDMSVEDTYKRLSIVEQTYYRWRKKAIEEYIRLSA